MSDYKQEFYNKYVTTHIAERKEDLTLDAFRIRSRIYKKHFWRHLPQDKRSQILDIGCGNGSIVWWLQQLGYSDTTGIDISGEQIDAGRKLGVQNLIQGNFAEFLLNKQWAFELIIARDVIEHLYKEDVLELLCQCSCGLQLGGKLMLQVPNGESPFFGRIRYGDFTHETAFSQTSLVQLLKMAGFNKVECFPAGPVVCGILSLPRVASWKLIEAFYRMALYAELGRSKNGRIVTQNIIAVASKV
jgi:2-polyprenyl-3-methyl-5-hydroxy-6-metoxy-1,4-benzoquinol methylase